MEVERRGTAANRTKVEKEISLSDILSRAERAYSAYVEAQKDVAKAYRESEFNADEVFKQKEYEARLSLTKAIDMARKARDQTIEQATKAREEATTKAIETRYETIKKAERAYQSAIVEADEAYFKNLRGMLEIHDKTITKAKENQVTAQNELWNSYDRGKSRTIEEREVIITYDEYKSAIDGDLGIKKEKLRELEGQIGRLIDLKADEAGFKVTDETRTNIGRVAILLSSKVRKTVDR